MSKPSSLYEKISTFFAGKDEEDDETLDLTQDKNYDENRRMWFCGQNPSWGMSTMASWGLSTTRSSSSVNNEAKTDSSSNCSREDLEAVDRFRKTMRNRKIEQSYDDDY